ncbi:MAG: glycine cleavage system protein GcvH [Actinomycetia bacterium]|nr:glycine cleavage system protein GcvH [Actinomycetes bacterium]MCP4226403.1 glycine cleavage system protein GcvH [Actinomycetes bacterium]MCP5033476.1 glycine cleavage system protein GcvH [Actinomycetes bacterium]
MNTPEDLRYSSDHEWVRVEADNHVRIGITDYAQDALGEVVYIELPEVGKAIEMGQALSEIESTKSVSELFAPVSGSVTRVNDDLVDNPERLNADPYGEGWICVVELGSESDLNDLMDASAYIELTGA